MIGPRDSPFFLNILSIVQINLGIVPYFGCLGIIPQNLNAIVYIISFKYRCAKL